MLNLEDVFGEDEDIEEILNLIRFEDYPEASNVDDSLERNDGWYNYSMLTFDYKKKRYCIEYKEHTSDNVSDFTYLYETFACLGDSHKMNEYVKVEDVQKERARNNRQDANLRKEISRLKRDNMKMKTNLDKLNQIEKRHLLHFSGIFMTAHEDLEKEPGDITVYQLVGEFFNNIAEEKE